MNPIKHFEKKILESEADRFHIKFKDKKYLLNWNALGDIVGCETTDKEIIKWLKDNGLTEINE